MTLTIDVVLEAISDGFFALDETWRFVAFNRVAETAFRVSREAVLGRTIWEVSPTLVGTEFETRYRAVVESGVAQDFEIASALRPDRLHEIRAFSLNGGLGVAFRDVTGRRQREDALRESEARLRLAIDAGRMAVWEWNGASGKVRGSPELNRLLGLPSDAPAEFDPAVALSCPGERDRVGDAARAALMRGDRHFEAEFRTLDADGTPRWLLLRAEMRHLVDGAPGSIVGVLLDVTGRKRAAERQNLLINELNHRVKNTLATVQSIGVQSLRNAGSLEEAGSLFEGRILALARAHTVLTRESWAGASLRDVIEQALAPFGSDNPRRLALRGPPVRLSPPVALALAMTLHELATNAVKHGALSNDTGQVEIAWHLDAPPRLCLRWQESGGPLVRPPTRRGFGTRLIERGLAQDLGGKPEIEFAPSGLRVTIRAWVSEP